MTTKTLPQPQEITPKLSLDRTTDGKPTWTQIPNWVIQRDMLTRLDGAALKVYLVRCKLTFPGKPCTYSQARIARESGLHRNSVAMGDRILEKEGLIMRADSYKVGERGKGVWIVTYPGGPNDSYCAQQSVNNREANPPKGPGTVNNRRSQGNAQSQGISAQSQGVHAQSQGVLGPGTVNNKDYSRLEETNKQEVVGVCAKGKEEETLRGCTPQYDEVIDQSIMPHLRSHLPQIAGRVTFDMVYEAIRDYSSVHVNKAIGLCNGGTKAWGGVLHHLANMPKRPPRQRLDKLRLVASA